MPLISDTRCGDWLLPRAGSWATVSGVVGTGFDAYVRIFHPANGLRQDRAVIDERGGHPVIEERDWRWGEVATRTGRTMHPRAQWTGLTGQEPPVAVETNDGWIIGPPMEGQLAPSLLAALAEQLGTATTTPTDLVAAVWDGWGDLNGSSSSITFASREATDEQLRALHDREKERQRQRAMIQEAMIGPVFEWPGRSFHLMAVSLQLFLDPEWVTAASVESYPAVGHTPQMLWPADHAWVLATEIDWNTTIVAGTKELVTKILADRRLETREVTADDDLSWAGDTLNTPSTRR